MLWFHLGHNLHKLVLSRSPPQTVIWSVLSASLALLSLGDPLPFPWLFDILKFSSLGGQGVYMYVGGGCTYSYGHLGCQRKTSRCHLQSPFYLFTLLRQGLSVELTILARLADQWGPGIFLYLATPPVLRSQTHN